MKALILTLLFAKEVLLTPAPVTILNAIDIKPSSAVSAISPGAGLRIDVTSMLSKSEKRNLFYYWANNRFLEKFPKQSVSAVLDQGSGKVTLLTYKGHTAISNQELSLIIDNPGNIPTGVKFSHIVVRSAVPLDHVMIYWKNYSK